MKKFFAKTKKKEHTCYTMKPSTDMFAAQNSRTTPVTIVLHDTSDPQGTAYSPFVISLRAQKNKKKEVFSQPIQTPEKKISPTKKKPTLQEYEHLFAAAAYQEDYEVPDQKTQIQKTRESMEQFKKNFSRLQKFSSSHHYH